MIAALAKTEEKTAAFFFEKTRQLVSSSSFAVVGGQRLVVDLVRDVLKLVPVYWAATEVVGVAASNCSF